MTSPLHTGSTGPAATARPCPETGHLSRIGALTAPDAPREFDAVVIGSGFGAAVAAARLAPEFGAGLAVLERGAEFQPGEFPETRAEAAGHVRSEASPFGIYDVRFQRDLDAVVANLVGGGSQLYCGVTIEPLPETFDIPRTDGPRGPRRAWPREITHAALVPHYDRVREMLEVETWEKPTRRGAAFDAAAQRAFGADATSPVPLAVTIARHRPDARNAHGVPRTPCTGCGGCVTGCNVGAKNSLTANYLPAAVSHGAQVHAGVEVLHLRRTRGEGRRWSLTCRVRDRAGRQTHRVLSSDLVVVAAGVFGTGGILAASRSRGLSLSPMLGTKISGNGDAISLAHRWRPEFGQALPLEADELAGPTITRMVDRRRTPGARFLIQDSVAPAVLSGLLAELLAMRHGTANRRSDTAADDLDESLMMLAMGYDSASGRLVERDGELVVDWPHLGSDPVHRASSAAMRQISEELGATYNPNPRFGTDARGTAVTVHALGGAPMAEHPQDAVVDPVGRVLDAAGRPHPGLYVTDASVIPTSVGSNPSLLIAANAERAMAAVLAHDVPAILRQIRQTSRTPRVHRGEPLPRSVVP